MIGSGIAGGTSINYLEEIFQHEVHSHRVPNRRAILNVVVLEILQGGQCELYLLNTRG